MNNATGVIVTGTLSITDRVVIKTNNVVYAALPAANTYSNGYPGALYTAGNANWWVHAVYEAFMISYPLSTTSIKLEWQWNRDNGGNYTSNYRITRALASNMGSETTIYSGPLFEYTDTGLIKGTKYYYRLYQTILGVESLLTNEKCIPQ